MSAHTYCNHRPKSNTLLWHKDIVLPPLPSFEGKRVMLRYSSHAKAACNDERYGHVRQLRTITLSRFTVIEVETKGEEIIKYVLRGSYDEQFDIVFVLMPESPVVWFVKTLWLQEKNDLHKTLNRSRYVRG